MRSPHRWVLPAGKGSCIPECSSPSGLIASKFEAVRPPPISLSIEDRLLRIDVVLQDLSPINQPWVLILLRDGRDYPRSLGALLAWFGTDEDWPVLPGVVAMAGRVRLR